MALSIGALAGDSRAASRDLGPTVVAWQVSVGAAPAEAYRSVAGIGLDVEVVRGLNTRPQSYQAGKKAWAPVRLVEVVSTASTNAFDTDLGRDVIKIVFEPTITDVIATAPADPKLPARTLPGATKMGKVTFTFSSSASVAEWGRTLAAGTATVREITINVRSQTGVLQRTMVLKHALLSSYACDGQQAQVVVQPDAMTLSGPANKVLVDWVQAGFDGQNARRDLKVTWSNLATHAVLGSTTLKGAFITEVAWGTLDAQSAAMLVDTITVQPDAVDPLP